MRRHNQRGVTLLELLIAVTLMSLLSGGILYALRVGIQALNFGYLLLLAVDLQLRFRSKERGREKCHDNANHQCAGNDTHHQPTPTQRRVPILKQHRRKQSMRILSSWLLHQVGGRVYGFVHVGAQFKS